MNNDGIIVTIEDVKAELFRAPVMMNNRAEAIRSITTVVNDEKSELSLYSGDFKLVVIGTWDAKKGVIQNIEHESLGFLSEYKKKIEKK